MTRKTPLTAQEHADLGAALAAIRDELLRRSVQVANAYPKTAPQATHLDKAVKAVDSARCDLDNALARDHPDAFDTHTYYPDQEDRARVLAGPGLDVICGACRKPIGDGEGNLWVDLSAVNAAEQAQAEWERRYKADETLVTVTAAQLSELPDEVPWRSHHIDCDPQPGANAYAIPATELRTWAELLDWTAHLMEKPWLGLTDWDGLLRAVVGGKTRVVAR